MYGIAQGRTRQWLRELAKENGIPYSNFTPPGAETNAQVRERAIKFFRKLCQELLIKFGRSNFILQTYNSSKSVISTENLHVQLTNKTIPITSSIDSAIDLSSDQQSITTSSLFSILSRNSSFEKQFTI